LIAAGEHDDLAPMVFGASHPFVSTAGS